MVVRIRTKERGGTPRTLAELLRSVYPTREPDDVAAIRVFHAWKRAVPGRIFRRARPVRLHMGTLYVNTATSAWSSELELMKETLLAAIRKRAPEARLKAIRFRVGPLPEMPPGTRPERKGAPPVIVAAIPESLARTLATIDDDDLRQAIREAASIGIAREAGR